jgi:hypothetical protein
LASLFVGEEALNIRQSLRHPTGHPVDGYFSVIAKPFRSALTIAPTELSLNDITERFGLASTIA